MQKQEYYRIEKMENKHFWYRGMRNLTLSFVSQIRGKPLKILDAGCGAGGRAIDCLKFGYVAALDINDTAVKLTRQKNIPLVKKADICALPFPAEEFDAVLCLDVIYHREVKNDLQALKECFRVLKPGGKLILRVPAFEFLRGSHDIVVYTKKRYTSHEVKKLVISAGFQILRLTYANFILSVPLVFKRLFERLFVKNHHPHSDSMLPPGVLNSLFYQILKAENKFLKYFDLPFGSSVICVCRKP